jgi:hypothetical protein
MKPRIVRRLAKGIRRRQDHRGSLRNSRECHDGYNCAISQNFVHIILFLCFFFILLLLFIFLIGPVAFQINTADAIQLKIAEETRDSIRSQVT